MWPTMTRRRVSRMPFPKRFRPPPYKKTKGAAQEKMGSLPAQLRRVLKGRRPNANKSRRAKRQNRSKAKLPFFLQ